MIFWFLLLLLSSYGYFFWHSALGGGNPDAIDVNDYTEDKHHIGASGEYLGLKYMTNFCS